MGTFTLPLQYFQMDTEIHRGADGLFAVCFKNYNSYNENTIREIFGRYGHVVSVRFSGKDTPRMVFVRYREYIATKNCLEALSRTPGLHVRMAVSTLQLQNGPKQQSGSFKLPDYNSSAGNQYSSTYNGPRRKFQQKPKNRHMENGNCSENCEKPRQNGEQSGIKSEVPEHEEPLNNEKVNGHSEHGSDDTNGKGSTKGDTAVSKANVEHPGNEDDLKNSDNSDQISQKSHTSNDVIDDGPPPLVDFEDIPDLVVERPKVYAKDIIIANLPPSVDLRDIMQLTKRLALNPIHISPIETTGIKYNIPFCHLWVKNDYEAEIAESALQGIWMAGNKLLVARAEKLLNTFRQCVNI